MKSNKIMITGSGPGVGKTVVSAVVTSLLQGDYWKPIECGGENHSDTQTMKKLIDSLKHQIFPPSYSFKFSLSPHHAARLEKRTIQKKSIIPPKTPRPLIIETAGGVLVPLTLNDVSLDLFETWGGQWIITSRHYIGSINHTLLTIEALRKRSLALLGVVFNGKPNPDSERAILEMSKLPYLGRLLPEHTITPQTIQKYTTQWRETFLHTLLSS